MLHTGAEFVLHTRSRYFEAEGATVAVTVAVGRSLRIRNSNRTTPWCRRRRACSTAPNRISVFARRSRSHCGSTFSFDTETRRSRRSVRARTAAGPRAVVAAVGAGDT